MTYLIEQKKAKLVLIANDVDPIELVVWLPALCRKMDVPYMIVANKGRLGTLVRQKKAAAVCLTSVDEAVSSPLTSDYIFRYSLRLVCLSRISGQGRASTVPGARPLSFQHQRRLFPPLGWWYHGSQDPGETPPPRGRSQEGVQQEALNCLFIEDCNGSINLFRRMLCTLDMPELLF